MRVAVSATERGMDGEVAGHFGNATHFVVAEIADGKVKSTKLVENPHAGRHVPGALPKFVKELGAEAVIVCGIGSMALEAFGEYGIKAIMGIEGKIGDALEKYASGSLGSEGNTCSR